MRIIRNFIDGTWRDSAGGRVPDVNPADVTDVIAEAPSSTAAEADEACEAAARAFEGWRRTPAPVRGQILFKIQRRMDDRRPELAEALTREEGKTLAESRGEIQRAINVVGFFAGEARRITANGVRFGLSASIYTSDVASMFRFVDHPAAVSSQPSALSFALGWTADS